MVTVKRFVYLLHFNGMLNFDEILFICLLLNNLHENISLY